MFFKHVGLFLRICLVSGALLISRSAFAAAQKADPVQLPDRARLDEVLNGMSRGQSLGQVAVAPDGKRLAWVQWANGGIEIRVAPLDDLKKSERVTAAAKPADHCQEEEIVWAPDAKALAFFSDCAHPGDQTDLYLSRIDGHAPRRLTALAGYVDAPAFSPDGESIAYLYVEGATRPAGALAPMKPPSGIIGEDGIEIQRVSMTRLDLAAPNAQSVTPANLHVFEFDWRHDSKGLAYIAADPPGENNWWVAKLYRQELNGAPLPILAPAEVTGPLHGLQVAVPRWSPDGKTISFIGGLMSDQGATGGDVWIISADGGEPRNLTPGRPTSPAWVQWEDNEHLYASELAGGNAQLIRLHLQKDQTNSGGDLTGVTASFGSPIFSIPGKLGDGRLDLSLSSTADRRIFVFRASTFDHPMEIYAAKPGTVMTSGLEGVIQLSHLNESVTPTWGKSVSISWKSDNFHVQGWLMLPKDYDPDNKYPLIVKVHGGPAAAVDAEWGEHGSISAAAFSAMGYFVLQPNPRGSFGQGEAFTQANRRDFGYGDLRDILAGVDTVLAKYPVDANRVGLTGWSYGGFMTMFAVTQTGRFKAAVAGAGISNWQSYYGQNSIDQWMLPYFGTSVYDDPAVYAKSSAIDAIKNVTTPTLAVVGDRDGECPAPQSFEFWHALRALHVPTQLVVYPDEGHGFVDPAHRRDVMERALEWFALYLPPPAPPAVRPTPVAKSH